MNTKTNYIPIDSQRIIAGITTKDDSIEFFGIQKTRRVMFLQNGIRYNFRELSPKYYALLQKAYKKDLVAVHFIKKITKSIVEQVELYTYYCYGALDHTPDILHGVLQPAENFRDRLDCPSLSFQSKKITIGGKELTLRELEIIDLVAQDYPDKLIADHLGIAVATLNTQKSNLFKKVNVQTKTALMMRAMNEQIPMI